MPSPSDSTPLESDRLDPRGNDWREVPQWQAMNYAVEIRIALDNLYGYAPDVVSARCREISAKLSDPSMYVAVFHYLSAPDRRRFKEYVRD